MAGEMLKLILDLPKSNMFFFPRLSNTEQKHTTKQKILTHFPFFHSSAAQRQQKQTPGFVCLESD